MKQMKRRAGLSVNPKPLVAVLVGIVVIAAALAFWRVGNPEVEVEPKLPGIGPATPVQVRLHEAGRGLTDVHVELVQGDYAATLAEESYTPRPFWAFWGQRQADAELTVEAGWEQHRQLKTGDATLRVTAGRAPTWVRRPEPVVVETTLPVRRRPPTLVATSSQVNVAQGGSEVVVYRVGPTAIRDGVEAGDWWFPGYPLPGGGEEERFALFAAPYDLDGAAAIRLVAEDDVGNRAEVTFVNRFTPRPLRRARIELSDDFMSRVVPEILDRSPEIEDQGGLLANYLEINGKLRRLNGERLRELAAESRQEFLWTEAFRQLPNTQVTASFADRRSYLYNGEEVDQQDHLGFDLASVERAPILASNAGVVQVAEFFGIFGNTVILDHGYGLASLYAHLSGMEVEEGQRVEKGQVLGRSGETGLAAGDHLHYSIMLQGLPVSPVEWWDAKWIRDHLKEKLGAALPLGEKPAGS